MRKRIFLPANEIHLWISRDELIADPEMLSLYQAAVAPYELERAARFQFQRHRRQYLVTRGLVRAILSLYRPEVAPREWRFCINAHGKPGILDDISPPLLFNLSHTDGLIVLAVARREVGVDVELLDREGDLSSLADRYFAPIEQKDLLLLAAAERRHRFVELWTLKEAYLKARGVGLTQSLDTFSFRLGTYSTQTLEYCSNDDWKELWRFWSLRLDAGYCLALAARNSTLDPEPIPKVCEFSPTQQMVPIRCLRTWQDEFGNRAASPALETFSADPF